MLEMQNNSTILAIFGGAGDLTWRKLIPALYNLHHEKKLSDAFALFIIDGKAISEANLLKHLYEGVKQFAQINNIKNTDWEEFASHVHYLKGDFKKNETYKKLKQACEQLQKKWDSSTDLIFYMATPPSLFDVIPKYLHDAGLSQDKEKNRLVVEKPIGYDLESAQRLNRNLVNYFQESQIFRIDHYLGKETVQNILAFRFANPLFEPIWNRRYIDYVTITVAETVGVEHRGGYYDHAGALRDMVQNHLMQLMCLVGMEPMLSFDADEIRNKKVDLLKAIRKIPKDLVHDFAVRGQYGNGKMDGKLVAGYRQEDGVSEHSQTETFVAIKLFVDNWRWQGVPFYLVDPEKGD